MDHFLLKYALTNVNTTDRMPIFGAGTALAPISGRSSAIAQTRFKPGLHRWKWIPPESATCRSMSVEDQRIATQAMPTPGEPLAHSTWSVGAQ